MSSFVRYLEWAIQHWTLVVGGVCFLAVPIVAVPLMLLNAYRRAKPQAEPLQADTQVSAA